MFHLFSEFRNLVRIFEHGLKIMENIFFKLKRLNKIKCLGFYALFRISNFKILLRKLKIKDSQVKTISRTT